MKLIALYFILTILFINNPAIARKVRIHSIPNNHAAINSDIINRLERRIFGRSFDYDTTLVRLRRLEIKVFGAEQIGNIHERIRKVDYYINNRYSMNNRFRQPQPRINRSVPHYNPYPNSNSYNSFTKTRQGLRNISKMLFDGTLTGYSPQVEEIPYYEYSSLPINENRTDLNSYNEENEYCDSYGNCYSDYKSIGSGAKIEIID